MKRMVCFGVDPAGGCPAILRRRAVPKDTSRRGVVFLTSQSGQERARAQPCTRSQNDRCRLMGDAVLSGCHALVTGAGRGVVSGATVEHLYREIRALRIYEGANAGQGRERSDGRDCPLRAVLVRKDCSSHRASRPHRPQQLIAAHRQQHLANVLRRFLQPPNEVFSLLGVGIGKPMQPFGGAFGKKNVLQV